MCYHVCFIYRVQDYNINTVCTYCHVPGKQGIQQKPSAQCTGQWPWEPFSPYGGLLVNVFVCDMICIDINI